MQIKGVDLVDIPVASVNQPLQGRVAGGAAFTTSGTSGAFQSIRIKRRSFFS